VLLLRDAEVEGARVDVRIHDGLVVEVAPDLHRRKGEEVVDVAGGAVIPGLHDHHLHLLALAAADASVVVGPPAVRDRSAFDAALREASRRISRSDWIRAVGYHESVAGDLDRARLDDAVPDRPLRVQHRSGALWILNSAAVAATGLDADALVDGVERDARGRATGRVWRADAWLRGRLPASTPPDLARISERLLRLGVTGVTDATPSESAAALTLVADAVGRGALRQRVVLTGAPGLAWDPAPGVEQGPAKLLFPDHEDPSLDAMVAAIRTAREQGRAVAIHAVTAVTAALAVAAWHEVGAVPGDRLEHGAVIPAGLIERIADLGITVVTNPGFVATRGDEYLTDVDPVDVTDLWRCCSLLDGGVAVAAGTDAPFGDPNPWLAIAAASERMTPSRRPLGLDERVPPARALAFFLTPWQDAGGAPRRVEPGARADLCVLPSPLDDALRAPATVQPAATVMGGELWRW
jgi:predicted amidohydrolase YtcJ